MPDSFHVTYSFMDSKKKLSAMEFQCSAADAMAYWAAADDAARAATNIGVHAINTQNLSLASLWSIQVKQVHDMAGRVIPIPDSAIYNHDKLTVYYQAGLENYVMTIPARDDNNYVVAGRQGDVVLAPDGTTEVEAFQTSFPGVVLGKNGEIGTVTGMRVVR